MAEIPEERIDLPATDAAASGSLTPLGDAIARIGQDGEGFTAGVTAGSNQKPAATVGGWFEWGKHNQWGAGGAVQWAKDAWAAVAKVAWRPGAK